MFKKGSYFRHELLSKLFSSKKKVIKFLAISLVPFLYGFICVAAFWNPVPNIGNVPMAVVDTSKRIDLAVGTVNDPQTQKEKMVIGIASKKLDQSGFPRSILKSDGTEVMLSSCLSYKKDYSFIEEFIHGWSDTNVKDPLISQNPNGTYTIKVSEATPLKNVSYFNDKTAKKATEIANWDPSMKNPVSGATGAWKVDDENYWLQIQIPEKFNSVLAYTLTSMYTFDKNSPEGANNQSWANELGQLKSSPLNIWTTFKKNFLFGQFMKVFHELKSSMIIDFYPRLIAQTIVNICQSIFESYRDNFYWTPQQDITFTTTETTLFSDGDIEQVNEQPQNEPIIEYAASSPINVQIPNKITFHNGTKGQKECFVPANTYTLKQGQKYIFRNDEIKNALKNALNNILPSDQVNELSRTNTFEGNTSTLVTANNDWSNSNGISFIDLIVQLLNPIFNNLFPQNQPPAQPTQNKELKQNQKASPINLATLSKYLTNKMFLASMFEHDPKTLPPIKSPIVNGILDTTVSTLIQSFIPADFPVLFSSNTKLTNVNGTTVSNSYIMATEQEWTNYISKLSQAIKAVIDNVIGQGVNKNFLSNAPPANSPLSGILTSGVIGEQFSAYGIGLGQFFLFIGVWVGILMQTFMLDRKRRGPAAKGFNTFGKNKKVSFWSRLKESLRWYFSKTGVMLFLMFFQVTILMATVAAFGWWIIGPPFGLLYLQLLFSGVVFVFFIQGFWFLFREDVVGKFIVILFLIINLSSGWGTFPPSMQFKFFEVLSYIAPFTYQIKNFGAIIYGIGVQGSNVMDNLFIMQNIGISLIFIIISIILGIIGSFKLTKMQYYGTWNGKKLAKVLMNLDATRMALYRINGLERIDSDPFSEAQTFNEFGLYPYGINFDKAIVKKQSKIKKLLKKDPNYITVDWNELPQGYNQYICDNFNETFPFETKFKWFKKKEPDYLIEIEDAKI